MKRRTFITLLGGAAAWPFAPRAQQPERMRRIGVLMNPAPDDPQSRGRVATFVQQLRALGWTEGHNVQIDLRWAAGDAARVRRHAAELVATAPDVILTTGGFGVGPLRAETRTIPIVFVSVADPVGSGFVTSLARPGGNATGFANFEYGISAKWLELLKEIAPRTMRAAVVRDPTLAAGAGLLGAMQSVAPSFSIELSPIAGGDLDEMEDAVTAFAGGVDRALVVTPTGAMVAYREIIITLAARYRLPAIYPYRFFVAEGGLISYGAGYCRAIPTRRGVRRSHP